MNNDKTEARFEALEMKLAFQEDVISKLDEALIDQQQQISDLELKVRLLTDQLRNVEGQMPDTPEPPPPHY